MTRIELSHIIGRQRLYRYGRVHMAMYLGNYAAGWN